MSHVRVPANSVFTDPLHTASGAGSPLSPPAPPTGAMHFDLEQHAGASPFTVVRRMTARPDAPALYAILHAVHVLGMHVRVANRVDASARVVLDVTLFADMLVVDNGRISRWWPRPSGWDRAAWLAIDDDETVFSDDRWTQFSCRAMWVRVRGHSGDSQHEPYLTWIADYSTQPLATV